MSRRLSPLAAQQTAVLIAEQLRGLILGGAYPPGEQLSESTLADQLQISRGPVREALQRLSQEGLVASRRNRGVFVVEFDEHDIAEIYQAREAVELAAARAVFEGASEHRATTAQRLTAIVEEMPKLAAANDWAGLTHQDMEFHLELVRASGNSRLLRMYQTLAAESQICMVNLEKAYRRPRSLRAQHKIVIDALESGRWPELAAAISEHMDAAVADLTVLMSRR